MCKQFRRISERKSAWCGFAAFIYQMHICTKEFHWIFQKKKKVERMQTRIDVPKENLLKKNSFDD